MTTKNHDAFLMCPVSRTTHLGGTPLESGKAGGHIKKTTWQHAHAAALQGLPAVVLGDQCLAHGLIKVFSGEQAQNCAYSGQRETDNFHGTKRTSQASHVEQKSKEAVLVHCLDLGGLARGQLGPDQRVIGTQLLSGYLLVRVLLNEDAAGRMSGGAVGSNLREQGR